MKPQIGITESHLQKSNAFLSSILANEMTLYVKLRKFHWNVAGENFMELHKLFERHYEKLDESMDEIAERISKLGFIVPGTLSEFVKTGTLEEAPGINPDQQGMIRELLQDHEAVIIGLRKSVDACEENFKDKGTSDFLTGLMQDHETLAWTLRKYLK